MKPLLWLGAPAPGRLALPDAMPTPSQMYAPWGVFFDDQRLIVADSGNHRILLWARLPLAHPAPLADNVIGQDSFERNGENRWKAVTSETLCWPYGIWLHNGRLAIADSGNNRVMIWAIGAAAVPASGADLVANA